MVSNCGFFDWSRWSCIVSPMMARRMMARRLLKRSGYGRRHPPAGLQDGGASLLCGVGQCHARNARALPPQPGPIHAIAHMQNELRRRSSDAFAMRHVVERPPQFRMFGNVIPDLVQTLPRRFQELLKLRLRFDL